MAISGIRSRQRKEHSRELLTVLGMEDKQTRSPAQLSGGEQQRVSVARALVSRPSIILADEPSGKLDRDNGSALLDLMWDMSSRYEQAFVVVTHDEAIGSRSDRVYCLEDGLLTSVAA